MARKPKPPPKEPMPPIAGKFTPEVRAQILSAVRDGCFRFQACALAGINRDTLLDWERRAKEDAAGEHAEFVRELERVQYEAEAHLQVLHHRLSTGKKLPDQTVAELTGELADFRQRAMLPAIQAQLKYGGSRPWAEVQKIEHTGKDGGKIEIETTATPEAAAALLREAFGGHARKALAGDDAEAAESAGEAKPKG